MWHLLLYSAEWFLLLSLTNDTPWLVMLVVHKVKGGFSLLRLINSSSATIQLWFYWAAVSCGKFFLLYKVTFQLSVAGVFEWSSCNPVSLLTFWSQLFKERITLSSGDNIRYPADKLHVSAGVHLIRCMDFKQLGPAVYDGSNVLVSEWMKL